MLQTSFSSRALHIIRNIELWRDSKKSFHGNVIWWARTLGRRGTKELRVVALKARPAASAFVLDWVIISADLLLSTFIFFGAAFARVFSMNTSAFTSRLSALFNCLSSPNGASHNGWRLLLRAARFGWLRRYVNLWLQDDAETLLRFASIDSTCLSRGSMCAWGKLANHNCIKLYYWSCSTVSQQLQSARGFGENKKHEFGRENLLREPKVQGNRWPGDEGKQSQSLTSSS